MTTTVTEEDALTTYRYLRITMPVLVVILGTSVIYQVFAPTADDCWLGSISAYYYTSARAVFVACLCAIGTCLIIYRGNTTAEDVALNISGFMAFVVAFIPTPLKKIDGPADPTDCARSNVPSEQQLVAALNNNIFALLVGATVAVGVIAWFRSRPRTADAPAPPSALAMLLTSAAVASAWAIFAVSPERVRNSGHIVAAVIVFAGIVIVVAINAAAAENRYKHAYRAIFVGMLAVVGVLGVIALLDTFDHAVFWLESGVIALFAVYWVVQTFELWNVTSRSELPES
jgi:uncharacterized membrane protein